MKKKINIYLLIISLLISCNPLKKKEIIKEIFVPRKVELTKLLGELFMNDLNQKIYKMALEGKIKAYKNDTLLVKDQLSLSKLKDVGSYQESIQYAPNPKDPEYMADTIITNPFRISDICGNSVAEKWTFEENESEHSGIIWAFAINYKYKMQGKATIELPELPLFWISYSDIKKILNKEQIKQLNNAIYQTLMDRIYLN